MTTTRIQDSINEYMTTNHLTHIDELWVVVKYDVEVLSSAACINRRFDSIDDYEVVNKIEESGEPIQMTTSYEEVKAALAGKSSEYYRGGDILYKRGYAAFGYEVEWNDDYEEFEIVDELGGSEAPTVTPFWEAEENEEDGD